MDRSGTCDCVDTETRIDMMKKRCNILIATLKVNEVGGSVFILP